MSGGNGEVCCPVAVDEAGQALSKVLFGFRWERAFGFVRIWVGVLFGRLRVSPKIVPFQFLDVVYQVVFVYDVLNVFPDARQCKWRSAVRSVSPG